ncbi:MAG TPA: ribosome maturation factor RimP [Vicinamibacterales bacterium]|nr:ribosome maturation factor RimP [Vicinamibacterales bacterium]
MAPVPEEALARLRAAAARIAASYGLEIFDLQFRRESIGWVLRVILDRSTPAGSAAEDPVSIDDCRRVSEDLSALLDVEDDLTAGLEKKYTLEVSSPGLDRPLRGEADYRRFTGRLAKIVTSEPVDGQSHFAGRLSGVDAGTVLVAEGKRMHRVPLAAISRARLEVEF